MIVHAHFLDMLFLKIKLLGNFDPIFEETKETKDAHLITFEHHRFTEALPGVPACKVSTVSIKTDSCTLRSSASPAARSHSLRATASSCSARSAFCRAACSARFAAFVLASRLACTAQTVSAQHGTVRLGQSQNMVNLPGALSGMVSLALVHAKQQALTCG